MDSKELSQLLLHCAVVLNANVLLLLVLLSWLLLRLLLQLLLSALMFVLYSIEPYRQKVGLYEKDSSN